jgi:cytochrome c-type biogenesis protein CcmH/NrfG
VTSLLVWSMTTLLATDQDRRLARPDAATGRRVALVIGNQAYPTMALKNAAADARDVHAVLRDVGFDADLVIDATKRQMDMAIGRFVDKLQADDVVVVYYAGHGTQIAGENYLLPIDVETADEASMRYSSYSASLLHDRIAERGARLKILILDACRNNPFRTSRSAGQGLAPMAAVGRGSFIAFATGPGSTAADTGLFRSALVEALREPGIGLSELFDRVRQQVDERSNGRQTPWSNSSVVGQFFFRQPVATPVPTGPPGAAVPPVSSGTPSAVSAEPPAGSTRVRPYADGLAALRAGNYDEAVVALREMTVRYPGCGPCWSTLGLAYLNKKDGAAAEAAFKKSIQIAPSTEAYTGLATIYNEQRRYAEAADAAREATRLEGPAQTAESAYNAGVIAWNGGKFDEARQLFTRAVALDPTLAVAHHMLGLAWLNGGRIVEAAASFEKYLQLAPNGEHAQQARDVLRTLKR